jgi:hypothetical protein
MTGFTSMTNEKLSNSSPQSDDVGFQSNTTNKEPSDMLSMVDVTRATRQEQTTLANDISMAVAMSLNPMKLQLTRMLTSVQEQSNSIQEMEHDIICQHQQLESQITTWRHSEKKKKMGINRDSKKHSLNTEPAGDTNQQQPVVERTANTHQGTTAVLSIGQSLENMMSILHNTTNVQLTKIEAFKRRQDEKITQLYQQLQRQGISINLPSNDAMNID